MDKLQLMHYIHVFYTISHLEFDLTTSSFASPIAVFSCLLTVLVDLCK